MTNTYKWKSTPRTIVHDKASYMVSPHHDRLQMVFAKGLVEGGLKSWLGAPSDSTEWLSARWGDVYPHETAISHVRRLLDTEYMCARTHETEQQFRLRMRKVERHMNSTAFAAVGGRGLLGLCKGMRSRCEDVIRRGGERIPK